MTPLAASTPADPAGHLDALFARVPATETFRVQEYHLPIYHCLSLLLEDAFFA